MVAQASRRVKPSLSACAVTLYAFDVVGSLHGSRRKISSASGSTRCSGWSARQRRCAN